MSTANPKQQLMVAKQQLDKLSLFIVNMADFFKGANPKIDDELKAIKKLLSGKPDYSGATELSVALSAKLKQEGKYMQQKNFDTLSQIQKSLRHIHELDVVDKEVKSEIKQFMQSLSPEKDSASSPISQFEQALVLFRKALSNNVVMQSQQDVKAQKALHEQITQELKELISPFLVSKEAATLEGRTIEEKTIQDLRQRLSKGLEHSELLECCLVTIRFILKDVIKESSTANKLIHNIHQSLSKINVGIKSTIQTSKTRMEKRSAQNKAMAKQITAIETALSDSHKIEDLKREATSYLNKMQSSLRASEADDRAEQEKMIALLQSMQKRLTELEQKAEGYKQKLLDQRINAMTDTLTKLPNRMAYEEKVENAFALAEHQKQDICMAIIDIDHFKSINDKYGHSVGDKTLQVIATHIKKNLSSGDFVARWGGEEFIALLPNSNLNESFERVEVMREKISKLPFMFKGNRVSVTVSIGLASITDVGNIHDTFEQADALLYQAKQAGRNQTKIKDAK
uniref:GGDEF domain-containing protein n=1 Tax=Ningiella ruwaisensis TaxID=2364274 RepID=UPI00109EE8F7|nr:GGDEF domain-containing protein [Ningiella ruwaisensis]